MNTPGCKTVAGRRTEHEKILDVPSRNTQADYFEDKGAEFSASKNIY
jgi:hypothetical protein